MAGKKRAEKTSGETEETGDSAPDTPSLGKLRKGMPTTLHALGDLHGWAPGLINYLISHELAEISIDGTSLGSGGRIDDDSMNQVFARPEGGVPVSGLRGLPQRAGQPVPLA